MRLSNGNWNDEVVDHVPSSQTPEVRAHDESVLNAAMAAYVLDYYGQMLGYTGDTAGADDARARAEAQRQAVRAQWAGSWFRRAWLGKQLGWVGADHLWLEPQPWAIVSGSASAEQRGRLARAFDELTRKPSPIGALVQSKGDDEIDTSIGTFTNGGVWPQASAISWLRLVRVVPDSCQIVSRRAVSYNTARQSKGRYEALPRGWILSMASRVWYAVALPSSNAGAAFGGIFNRMDAEKEYPRKNSYACTFIFGCTPRIHSCGK